MKKIFVSLLAATMAVGMSVSAFAASTGSKSVPPYGDTMYGETTISTSTVYGDTWMKGGSAVAYISASLTSVYENLGNLPPEYNYAYNTDEMNVRTFKAGKKALSATCEHKVRDANGVIYRVNTSATNR